MRIGASEIGGLIVSAQGVTVIQPEPHLEPGTRRPAWLAAGVFCLALGTIGIVVPLLPTVDMVGLAAFCFACGDRRWEAWLLAHPRLWTRPSRAAVLPCKN